MFFLDVNEAILEVLFFNSANGIPGSCQTASFPPKSLTQPTVHFMNGNFDHYSSISETNAL